MMQRYTREFTGYNRTGSRCYDMLATVDGNYVKYEDVLLQQLPLPQIEETLIKENTRLEKLNQELYEVVSHLSVYRDSIVPNSLIDEADKVLKKVRGEGE